MATIKIDKGRRRWLISPAHVMERSALFELPSRKWMTQMNVIMAAAIPSNARVLLELIKKGKVTISDPQTLADLTDDIDYLLKPARSDRQFPDWFKFNMTKFPPAEHQREALQRVYPTDAFALLMEMGTMKTRVMIDCMTAHFYEQRIKFVIVITPVTVKMTTWQDELENFSACPYNFIDVESDFQARNFRVAQDRLNWLVVGVESLSQGKTFRALEPVTRMGLPYACGVDESTRIANHGTICTKAAFALRKQAAIRFIATGHEIKRNIEDLYSQFEFLDPNIIGCGNYYAFRNRYCMMGGFKGKEIIGYQHDDELMGLIAPHVFQCDKSILKLPPKLYEKRMVEMSPEQKRMYIKVKSGLMDRVSVENTLTKTLRMQQIANGFVNTDRWERDPITGEKREIESELIEVVPPSKNPKLRELLQIAKEVSHPMIVWVETQYERRIVVEALSKLGEVVQMFGDTPKEDRRGIVQRFQSGTVPYFVGTASAGGIGITITAARTVVYFSNNQRLEYRVQSEDRAHRKGQTGSVTIIDLIAKGTVDLSVLKLHAEKIDLARYVKQALHNRIRMEQFYMGEVEILAEDKELATA